MKKIGSFIGLVLLVASCSSPKYVYHFDHYDYNSGKKKPVHNDLATTQSPLVLDQETVVATASESPVVLAEEKADKPSADEVRKDFAKKYNAMSKAERKEFREDLKKELKAYAKAKKEGKIVNSTNTTSEQLDYDLKMAILFGAVGLTLTLFGGVSSVFWVLGVIGIVIAVVFLVRWLMRQ
ncbi:MAG TPA: hypothetical protein VGK59_01150 [Ohtaekwangia sp.]